MSEEILQVPVLEKKVVSVKKWTVTVTEYEDGTASMDRKNEGFNPLELQGLSDFVSWEVREQILGRIIPDTVTRRVIKD